MTDACTYLHDSTRCYWKFSNQINQKFTFEHPVLTQTIHLQISNFNTFYFHQFATRPMVHSMKCLKLYLKYLTFEYVVMTENFSTFCVCILIHSKKFFLQQSYSIFLFKFLINFNAAIGSYLMVFLYLYT